MDRGTLLIIDDDRVTREAVSSILTAEGYHVLTAADGEEGIEVIRKNPVLELILLDMMMPRMNGWGFLDFFRNCRYAATVPIVIMSAYTEMAKSVRPQAVVPKPIELQTLLNTVENLVA